LYFLALPSGMKIAIDRRRNRKPPCNRGRLRLIHSIRPSFIQESRFMKLSNRYTSLLLLPALFLTTAVSSASAAEREVQGVKLPDTAAAGLMAEWASLCAKPDLAQMTAWMSKHLSADGAERMSAKARATDGFELCSANGGLAVVDVAQSDPTSIALTMKGIKSGGWFEMLLIANAAGEVDRNGNRPAFPAESSLPAQLTDAVIASEVKRIVGALSQAGQFSGVVSVARGSKIIASTSAGHADRARKTPISGSSRFTLASMGKMFTAVAIGQLVDRHKLKLDDTVGKFFPEYPNRTVRDKVSVAMLLTHTSGLGDFLDKRTPAMMKDGVQRAAEFMPLYDADEPQFTPGEGRAYSNTGLALAGAIVEKISGDSYPDYLRKHVFEPAGMTQSSANNVPHTDAGLVTPYTRDESSGWRVAEGDIGSPAGGAISTADDLVRFAEALRSGSLVSKAWFSDMTSPHGPSGQGGDYGYAMEVADVYGETVVGHSGGFPGVSTRLYLVLGSPYTVVVLANQDPPAEAGAGMPILALVAEKARRERAAK
jgi:CubicO group peptidase (beta-lactamase class C family)